MATTTVAAGKVKVHKLNHRPVPPGWVVDGGRSMDDPDAQDAADADALYRLLEDQVVPTYYQRDQDGLPHAWLRIVKECVRTITPQFCAARMLKQYVEESYVPAARQSKDSSAPQVRS